MCAIIPRMAYGRSAIKRIKRLDPVEGLSDDIKLLSLLEHELSTQEYERESDQLKASDLRIKAIMGRAKIRVDMLDRVAPRARSVELSTTKSKPFQVELDLHMPEGVDVKLP